MVARMPRYAPAASGVRSTPRIPASGQNGSSRHVLALYDSSSRRIIEQSSALNPRVRGSSPWRRTRFDLGFYHSRSFFIRPVCPGFPAVLAPCLLAGRMLGARPLVQFGSIGLDQLSEPLPVWLRSAIGAGQRTRSQVATVDGSRCGSRKAVRTEPAVTAAPARSDRGGHPPGPSQVH
jgi:hypothetical protein